MTSRIAVILTRTSTWRASAWSRCSTARAVCAAIAILTCRGSQRPHLTHWRTATAADTLPILRHQFRQRRTSGTQLFIRKVDERLVDRAANTVHVSRVFVDVEKPGHDFAPPLPRAHVCVRRLAISRVVVGVDLSESHD